MLLYKKKHYGNKIGDRYGYTRKDGYRAGSFKGKPQLEHRLIWVYHHSNIPNIIDHKDRENTNNRIENLRDVSQVENCKNTKLSKNSTSGATGVSYIKTNDKWRAYYTVKGKQGLIGRFSTKDEAVLAREAWEKETNWFE